MLARINTSGRFFPFALLTLVGAVGCAASQPQAQSPASMPYSQESYPPPPPTEVDAAEQELDRNEQELDRHLALRTSLQPAAPSEAAQEESPAPAAAGPIPQTQSMSGPAESKPVDPCDTVCQAFRSMKRSADRLCTLAGQEHARCERARSRVDGASGRIRSAGCDCGCGCGGGE